jgi:hypothetical protein
MAHVPDPVRERRDKMPPSRKAIAVTLLCGIMAVGMTACSRDLPDEPGAGTPQADVSIAQVPANDDIANAVEVTTLPFSDNLNTSEATTTADEPADPEDPAVCFIGGHTVWYTFTPSENMTINANTFGSDYDTGIAVYSGTPGALTFIECNDDAITGFLVNSNVNFDAVAGETYYFMVGSFGNPEFSPGGNLTFRVDVSVELGVTIDPTGRLDAATGTVTTSGTVTCLEPVSGELFGEIRQRIGSRSVITGTFAFVPFECDGATSWQVEGVGPDNGFFAAGRVQVHVSAYAFDRDFTDATATVRLGKR